MSVVCFFYVSKENIVSDQGECFISGYVQELVKFNSGHTDWSVCNGRNRSSSRTLNNSLPWLSKLPVSMSGLWIFHVKEYFYFLARVVNISLCLLATVEPRFNEPPFNEVLDITNENLRPGQNYSKMYGTEPRYNKPRYSEFLDVTNIIRKPKRKIYNNYSMSPSWL